MSTLIERRSISLRVLQRRSIIKLLPHRVAFAIAIRYRYRYQYRYPGCCSSWRCWIRFTAAAVAVVDAIALIGAVFSPHPRYRHIPVLPLQLCGENRSVVAGGEPGNMQACTLPLEFSGTPFPIR